MLGWLLWDPSLFMIEFNSLIPTADGHVIDLGSCKKKPITSSDDGPAVSLKCPYWLPFRFCIFTETSS